MNSSAGDKTATVPRRPALRVQHVLFGTNAPTVNVTQFDTVGVVGGSPGFTPRGSTSPTSRYELAQGGTEHFLSSIAAEEPTAPEPPIASSSGR